MGAVTGALMGALTGWAPFRVPLWYSLTDPLWKPLRKSVMTVFMGARGRRKDAQRPRAILHPLERFPHKGAHGKP